MVAFLVTVAAASLGILLVLLVALLQQLRRVAGSLAALQKELGPVLEDVRDDAERARERLERLERAREAAGRRPDPR